MDVEQDSAAASSPRRPLPPDRPSRLLVADDEHLVASGLAATLMELGYEVVGTARDGLDALEQSRRLRPHLVIMDIRMPRMDGVTAAMMIHKELGIPVMLLSAFSDEDQVTSAAQAGVFGYVLKPISLDQFRVNIAISWGRYLDFTLQSTELLGLRERLADRKVIEQAKWIIVKRQGVEEPEAQRMLQRLARNNRRTLADVARSVVENEQILSE